MKYLYGIDIGGTTVKMGLFGEDGTLKEKWEIKTRTEENGKNILPDIAQAVNDHSKANGFDKEDVIGLGVGVPGAVLEFSKVNECVNLGWGSHPRRDPAHPDCRRRSRPGQPSAAHRSDRAGAGVHRHAY